ATNILPYPVTATPPRSSTRTQRVRAIFNYNSAADDELNLVIGDEIILIEKRPDGWWRGELRGRNGLFPGNFVKEI
ncbi:unnamed protein product, partial [Didymodactylos carnosus]